MSARRVVLTGRAVVSPLGVGLDAHWAALAEGRGAITTTARPAALGLPATRAAAVTAEAIQPHLGRLQRKQQKLYNRATLLGMLGASLAMDDAGLTPGGGDAHRLGVVLGVNVLSWDLGSMTQYLLAAEAADGSGQLDMSRANRFCMHNINPLDFSLKTLPNLAAGHMAIAHEAQGMCRALTEGSVGGAHAIGEAYRAIVDGELDAALCGGTDALIEELVFAVYDGAGFLASDDGRRPGFVAAEGSGLLVLEEAGRARRRGATVYGEVLGFATVAGEGEIANRQDPARLSQRIAGAVESVLDAAGRMPDVVSLHGDGTAPVDAAEEIALAKVLGARASGTAMIRLKKAHGDMGAASGAVEFLACSALLQHAIIPSIVSIGSSNRAVAPTHALVLSLGQFGEAAALVLGPYDAAA
ncbi:MAG: beta-ketoacyl synthase N-terminal-like domain-containing protein [Candidatus Rokuibacteriota bacterium]